MSEQNKSVVRRYVVGLNEENLGVFDEILAPDFANHSPRLGIMSREATVHDFALIFKAFPDRHSIIEDIIAEGDKVFLRTTVQGTHQDFVTGISIEPTGKNITWDAWEVLRFNDGRIVERWAIHNFKDQVEAAAREQKASNQL